jgi:thioredoxin 2
MATDSVIVSCPQCGAKNRVPAERLSEQPRCGRCKTLLPTKDAESHAPFVVSDASFTRDVLGSPLPVVLDCWAPWCGPCRMVSPILGQLASEWSGQIRVGTLNVDENPGTASRYGIQSIPTLILFRNGSEVDRMVGAAPKHRIERWVRSHL